MKVFRSMVKFVIRMRLNNFEGKIQQLVPERPFESPVSRIFIEACKKGNLVSVEQILFLDKFVCYQHDFLGLTGAHWAVINDQYETLVLIQKY